MISRYPPLLKQLKDLTERLHGPPTWQDSDVVVTTGSQSGLLMAMEMMISPNDYVIIEEPCYTGAISIVSDIYTHLCVNTNIKY